MNTSTNGAGRTAAALAKAADKWEWMFYVAIAGLGVLGVISMVLYVYWVYSYVRGNRENVPGTTNGYKSAYLLGSLALGLALIFASLFHGFTFASRKYWADED